MSRSGAGPGGTPYRIEIRGFVTERLAAAFGGMTVEPGLPTSALTGTLRD